MKPARDTPLFQRTRDTRSVPEIHKPSLNQPLHYGKNDRGRHTEHERSIGGFERSEQSPRRCHNHITVPQGRIVDRRVVVGGAERWKFSAEEEQHRPHRDLKQVRHERD